MFQDKDEASGGPSTGPEDPLLLEGAEMISSVSRDVRDVVDAYVGTLKKATEEVRVLAASKARLEKSYEELLATNETLLRDLVDEVGRRRDVEAERDRIALANAELFDEAQRLSDGEALWADEKEQLEAELARVTRELDTLTSELCDAEAPERHPNTIDTLKSYKSTLNEEVSELEIENRHLVRKLEIIEEERDAILTRKEMVSAENMQLMIEAENNRLTKADLMNQLRSQQERCHELEQENLFLRSAFPTQSSQNEITNEKYASLVERNKLLSEWREQLIEKNQVLADENKKLKAKCNGLEELLRDEETDISDVLELIRNMQGTVKIDLSSISPMSAFAAKLRRDFK